jgi:hypothetical protein
MTTVSWSYDKKVPLQTTPIATHSTYYGSSSLASSSTNVLVLDKYSPESLLTTYRTVQGVPNSNTTIYDYDKPALGIEQFRTTFPNRVLFHQDAPNVNRETVPNVNVLKSKYTLKGASNMNTRPTALI